MSRRRIVGIETECGNAILGVANGDHRACQLLLSTIARQSGQAGFDPCIPGRDFLQNGFRIYPDHTHVELCTPECLTAADIVAAYEAGLRILTRAIVAAEAEEPALGTRLLAFVANSDGQGHSWGSHLNVLADRRAFDLLGQKPHRLYDTLAPLLATMPVITGAGKVGAENGPWVDYCLAARADFICTAAYLPRTTYGRPLLNSRDESLADERRWARFHVIPLDSNRHQTATYLKANVVRLVIAMLEQELLEGARYLRDNLTLDEPIRALRATSQDPSLRTELLLSNGRRRTALALQAELLSAVHRFADTGGATAAVPDAADVIALWGETLERLTRRDDDWLVRRIDWVAKYWLCERQASKHGWDDPSVKQVDLLYAALGERDLFTSVYGEPGYSHRVVTEDQVRTRMQDPPANTRAWLRGSMLRRFGGELDHVDWHEIRVCDGRGYWPHFVRAEMGDPTGDTATESAHLAAASSLKELVRLLGDRVRPTVGGGVRNSMEPSVTTGREGELSGSLAATILN